MIKAIKLFHLAKVREYVGGIKAKDSLMYKDAVNMLKANNIPNSQIDKLFKGA